MRRPTAVRRREPATGNNIANVNTTGFKAVPPGVHGHDQLDESVMQSPPGKRGTVADNITNVETPVGRYVARDIGIRG